MTELSVTRAAHDAFLTANAREKARCARAVAAQWQAGQLKLTPLDIAITDRPGRPEKPELRTPGDMPRRRKAGSLSNRQALIHAIAHIELNAIDLALDMVVRFGADMPVEFTHDWISVADDEARHFQLLDARLTELGIAYGDLPAHDGLWQAAYHTRNSLDARLAIVPMVLEARGLDVTPGMIERLDAFNDKESADALRIIYDEEVRHVAIGTKWFKSRARKDKKDPETYFQELVTTYFHSALKRPFNTQARDRAEFPACYYEPLAPLVGAR